MKKLALAIAMVVSAPLAASAATYKLDPMHTEVGFDVKHMMVTNVHGKFDKFDGTVNLDEKDPSKDSVEVSIDTGSIDTGVDKRDAHLKSPDFFDAANNPKITFKSTKVKKVKGGLEVTGDLNMHGVTKPVTLKIEGPTQEEKTPFGTTVRAVSASATLNREDFGLKWNKTLESGGVLVSKDVKLSINAELVKQADEAQKESKAESKPAAK
jgi:polyisoprenoid-binding protein YceI